jgi:hypothetical protein
MVSENTIRVVVPQIPTGHDFFLGLIKLSIKDIPGQPQSTYTMVYYVERTLIS